MGDSFVKRIFSMQMRMEYAKPTDPKEDESKPLLFDQWTQYIVASELRDAVRDAGATGAVVSPLVSVLRKEAGAEHPIASRQGQGQAAPVPQSGKLRMLQPPQVFTLGTRPLLEPAPACVAGPLVASAPLPSHPADARLSQVLRATRRTRRRRRSASPSTGSRSG